MTTIRKLRARPPKGDVLTFERDPAGFIKNFIHKTERGRPYRLPPHHEQALRLAFTWVMHEVCERCSAVEEPVCVGHLQLRLYLHGEPKKSGKSLLAGLLILWWALTRPGCEAIVCANDLEQGIGRIFKALIGLLRHNPHLDRGVKILEKEARFSNTSTVTVMASEYRGIAGANHSLYVIDEPWGIMSERAERLIEELTPPPTEVDAWGLMVTTAGWVGESTHLEALYKRGLTGAVLDPDLPLYRIGELTMLWSHTPRMPTQTKKYLAEQQASLRPNTFARLWRNEWVSSESTFLTPALWDPCIDPQHAPVAPNKRIIIHVGVDCGVKHDCAAVVAVAREHDELILVSHRIWTPSPEQPLDIEQTIEMEIYRLAHEFTLAGCLIDPWQMARSIAKLTRDGVPVVEYAQTVPHLTIMGQALLDSLKSHALVLYDSPELRQQALNTTAIESIRGFRISKERASKNIDGIVALAMACVAALDAPAGLPIDFEPSEEERAQLRAFQRWAGLPPERWGGADNVVVDDEAHWERGDDPSAWAWRRFDGERWHSLW